MPEVSVIIPNYNYAHYLPATVESVLSQSFSDLECVIVDDGSTDDSRQVILALEKKDARVKLVFKTNGGLSSARNAGIRVASGKWIAFLDSDDLWKKDKLRHQLECAAGNPDCNFIFSNYEGFYPDRTELFKHVYGDPALFDFIRQNPIAGSASSAMLKKKLVDRTGFFDETLRSTEDHDYWFRSALAGAKMKFCNQPDVLIRLHETSMSANAKRMNHYNFIVLRKQLNSFPAQEKNRDLKQFRQLAGAKMQSLLWVARDTRDGALARRIYRLGLKHLGLKAALAFLKANAPYDFTFFFRRKDTAPEQQ